jgi:hypothetical protein
MTAESDAGVPNAAEVLPGCVVRVVSGQEQLSGGDVSGV